MQSPHVDAVRILGVMLKVDFQRAVLQRIPQITAQPKRTWRDLLFVCDEYHAFATVGETDPTGDERTFALSRQSRLVPTEAGIISVAGGFPAAASTRPGGGQERRPAVLGAFRTTSGERPSATWLGPAFRSGSL
jgi:hypothetical protein